MSDNVNILQPSAQAGPVHLLDVFSMLMDGEEDDCGYIYYDAVFVCL